MRTARERRNSATSRRRRSNSVMSEMTMFTVKSSISTLLVSNRRKTVFGRLWGRFVRFVETDLVKFVLVPIFVLPMISFGLHGVLVDVSLVGQNKTEGFWDVTGTTDPGQMRNSIDMMTRDIVIILALLVTASFITLQMFASQFLPHTISLFFRNSKVIACLGFFVVSVLFTGYGDVLIGPLYLPKVHLLVIYMIRFLSLSLTLPFFSFLVSFLSPEALIRQVCNEGLQVLEAVSHAGKHRNVNKNNAQGGSSKKIAPESSVLYSSSRKYESNILHTNNEPLDDEEGNLISNKQIRWINAIELITDIGLSTLKHKDKESANTAMLSLYTIACTYSKDKATFPGRWFQLSRRVKSRPDFSSLSNQSMEDMLTNRYWAEYKILRAYQILIETATQMNSGHLAGLGAFYTRKIGELAANKGDSACANLCIRFLNSYLQFLINGKQVKILSGVLNEYREYASELMFLNLHFKDAAASMNSSGMNRRRSFGSAINKVKNVIKTSFFQRSGRYASGNDSSFNSHNTNEHGAAGSQLMIFSEFGKRRRSTFNDVTNQFVKSVRKGVFTWGPVVKDADRALATEAELKAKAENCLSSLMSIVKNLRYYMVVCSAKDLGPIAETIAHDVGTLCAEGYKLGSDGHEDLLTVFLTLDDTQRSSSQTGIYRGIRRAQIKLAALYLVHGEIDFAKEIQKDMDDEPLFRLRHIYREIMSMEKEHFWEITFRSQNLDYMPPEFKDMLEDFFTWFTRYSYDDITKPYLDSIADTIAEFKNGDVGDDDDVDTNEEKVALPPLPHEMRTERRRSSLVQIQQAARRRSKRVTENYRELMALKRRPHIGREEGFRLSKLTDCFKSLKKLGLKIVQDPTARLLGKFVFWAAIGIILGLLLDYPEVGIVLESHSLSQPDANSLMSTLAIGGVLTFVLLCVTSMIILQLVAARYKFHPDMLSFLRDPVLYVILLFIIVSCMITTWTGMWTKTDFVPTSSISTLTVLVTLDILLLVLYFVRLFMILQPEKILKRVQDKACWHIGRAIALRDAFEAAEISYEEEAAKHGKDGFRSTFTKRRSSLGLGEVQTIRRTSVEVSQKFDNISDFEDLYGSDDDENEPQTARGRAGNHNESPTAMSPSNPRSPTRSPIISNESKSVLHTALDDPIVVELQVFQKRIDSLSELIREHQFESHEHMKRICDFGFACVQQSDETNLNAALVTLRWLVQSYSVVKPRLPKPWFHVSGKLRRTSDFINFSSRRVRRVSKAGTWFEWKVLAQYLLIFDECILGRRTEACQYISLNTRFIGETLLRSDDYDAYVVVTKFLNSFIRRSINEGNIQVASHCVTQYEKLLTRILLDKCDAEASPEARAHWGQSISEQAWYLKYYAQLAIQLGHPELVESVAMSLGEVCSLTFRQHKQIHETILKMLLTIDDIAEQDQHSFLGIRRAQIKLATTYLCYGLENYALMVAKDLIDESHHKLELILEELLSTNRPEFWEVSDNGVPFEYLDELQKAELPRFFRLVEAEREAAGKSMDHHPVSITEKLNTLLRNERKENVTTTSGNGETLEGGFSGFKPRTFRETMLKRRSTREQMTNTASHGRKRKLKDDGFKMGGVSGGGRLGSGGFRPMASPISSSSASAHIRASLVNDDFVDVDLEDFLDAVFASYEQGQVLGNIFSRIFVPILIGLISIVLLFLVSLFTDGGEASSEDISHAMYSSSNFKDTTLSMEMILRTFSVIVMCSLIALQKSAARMVRHVWLLYRKSGWVRVTWICNICAIILSLWNAACSTVDDEVEGKVGGRPILSLVVGVLSSCCLLTLYPYFSYFFVFLDEDKLLSRIVLNDLKMLGLLDRTDTSVQKNVGKLVNSMQRITDFASSSIRAKNKNNSFKCVTALYCINRCYSNIKFNLSEEFFSQFVDNDMIAASSDFSRLTTGFKAIILEEKTWVEWKVLRQYLFLYQESIGYLSDVCYRITISAKLLAEAALSKGDLAVLDLVLKFLNTFLKEAIERKEVRLAFGILFQYRKLAENMLVARFANPLSTQESSHYVLDIAWYFRYYALFANRIGLPFLTDLINHDISMLCITACKRSLKCHDRLLHILLRSYEKEGPGSRRGIRRAQFKLAAFYAANNHEKYVKIVIDDLLTEKNIEDIAGAYMDLNVAGDFGTRGFWEVNERMYNMDAMVPIHLDKLNVTLLKMLPEVIQKKCIACLDAARKTRNEFQKLGMITNSSASSMRSGSDASDRRLVDKEDKKSLGFEAALSSFSREVCIRAKQNVHVMNQMANHDCPDDRNSIHESGAGRGGRKQSSVDSDAMDKKTRNSSSRGGGSTNFPMSDDTTHNNNGGLANLLKISWIPIAIIIPLVTALTVLSMVFDGFLLGDGAGAATQSILEFYFKPVRTMFYEQSLEDKQRIMKMLAKCAVIIFCIVLTPTLIMLQINSRYLLGVIAEQYFSDRRVSSILMFYTLSSVFILWMHFISSSYYAPASAVAMSTISILIQILVLFPYFATLFEFLDPSKVVARMMNKAYGLVLSCQRSKYIEQQGKGFSEHLSRSLSVHASKLGGKFEANAYSRNANSILKAQMKTNQILQQLGSFAGASIQEKDKHNFANCVRVLSTFIDRYLSVKHRLDINWFDATVKEIRNSQDFISLGSDQLDKLKEDRCWVESLLLRQFLNLYAESNGHMEEGALLIAIETVKMGLKAIEVLDKQAIEHIIQMFNTYIRTCINTRAVRLLYNTMHQYRQFSELLIVSNGSAKGSKNGLSKIAYTIAKYMRYYGTVACNVKLGFMVEIIAFDLASMCETAYLLGFDNNVTNDRILTELLSLFDGLTIDKTLFAQHVINGEPFDIENLDHYREALAVQHGSVVDAIGRACMKLATLYVEMGDIGRAKTITKKLQETCAPEVLHQIRGKLECSVERDFLEVNDRGSDFNYVSENRREHIVSLFTYIENENHLKQASKQARGDIVVLGDIGKEYSVLSLNSEEPIDDGNNLGDENNDDEEDEYGSGLNERGSRNTLLGTAKMKSLQNQNLLRKAGSNRRNQTSQGNISALVLGAAMIKRRIKKIREAKEKEEQRMKEASELLRKESKENTVARESRRKTLNKMLSNVNEDRDLNLDEFEEHSRESEEEEFEMMDSDAEKARLEGVNKRDRRVRSTITVDSISRANEIRNSRRGSAANLDSLLPEFHFLKDGNNNTVTTVPGKSRVKVGAELKNYRTRHSAILSQGLTTLSKKQRDADGGEKASKSEGNRIGTENWMKAMYVVPIILMGSTIFVMLIDCGVNRKRDTICSSTGVFHGFTPDQSYAKFKAETLTALSLILMTYLGSILTVSTIVIQIVASRYTPRVATSFLRSKRVVSALITFLSSAIFVSLQASMSSNDYVSPFGFGLSLFLFTVCFCLLMPYISLILMFLDATNIFKDIANEGLRAALEDCGLVSDGPKISTKNERKRGWLFHPAKLGQRGGLKQLDLKISNVIPATSAVAPSGVGSSAVTASSVDEDLNSEAIKYGTNQLRPGRADLQMKAIGCISQLCDYSVSALRLKDKHNAFSGIDLLTAFALKYLSGLAHTNLKVGVEICTTVSKDPDFVSLSDSVIRDFETQHTWILSKVLKQMLKLYEASLKEFTDGVLRVSRSIRHIFQQAVRTNNMAAVKMCSKFMNTILMLSITRGDYRASDTVVLQYRYALEFLLSMISKTNSESDTKATICIDMISYQVYYAHLAFGNGMISTCETITHDLASLSVFARHLNNLEMHEYIINSLSTFLSDLNVVESTSKDLTRIDQVPRGIIRALIKLATIYITEFGDAVDAPASDARRIYMLLHKLHKSTLKKIWNDFKMLGSQDFWEISDRGANLDALTKEQKKALVTFFYVFTQFDAEDMESNTEKKEKLTQLKRGSIILQAPNQSQLVMDRIASLTLNKNK